MRRAQWVQRVQRVQFWQQRSQSVQWVQTWSSTTIRGSCSTATTFLQHSSSLSVRLPVPGPISRTVSVALIPAFSIIAAVTSGFLSKCCPSEWWSSTPAWRYGAAAWRCSGFFSRPTLGMSELAYTISVRRKTARAQGERCQGTAVHAPAKLCRASLRGRQRGQKVTDTSKLSKTDRETVLSLSVCPKTTILASPLSLNTRHPSSRESPDRPLQARGHESSRAARGINRRK